MAVPQVIVPLALMCMIPPPGDEFVTLIKNSSLVSLLAITNPMHEGRKNMTVSYRGSRSGWRSRWRASG